MIIRSKLPNRDVPTAMRHRLMSNRDGRLSREQWISIVTDPIIAGMLLISPLIVILGPRFKYLLLIDFWLLLLLFVVIVTVPGYRRAKRYRALPMRFAVLRSPQKTRPVWQFWREEEFVNDEARPVRFKDRLSPSLPLVPDEPYLVYYLEERGKNILLSYAPAEHPQSKFWQPTAAFQRRQRR